MVPSNSSNNDGSKMQLSWMILFSLCLLVTCRASAPVDGSATSADEDNVELKRSLLRSGSRRSQQDGDRIVGDEDDDQATEVRMNSNVGDQPRRSRFKSDNTGVDANDADQTGRGRIRVLSAGFRRMGDSNLRPLHDPTLTDNDLNRLDDNNIENELNALAAGFGQNNDVKVVDVQKDNYEGLGFDDTGLSLQDHGLDTVNDLSPKENILLGPPWSEWRHCNVTCGVGQQSRWRRCRDDEEGVCNRVTGRQVEWRRCLGMECDQKTIKELGGGCKNQLMMSLVIGVLIGSCGSLFLSAAVSCLYAWCKNPFDWKLSDFCPESCINSCAGCGGRCNDCCKECCDPYRCAGCGGPCLCCWCQPCCDPYAHQDRLYYHKQMRMNNAYQRQHNLGPDTPYKRPPAPLPRESVKRNPYYDDPEYAEISQFYQNSPRKKPKKKQKEKQNYVKFTKPVQRYPDSFDEREGKKPRAPQQVENDYMDIIGDDDNHDDIENAYLTPTRYEKPVQRYPDSFDEHKGKKPRAPQQVENDYMDILGDDDHHENAYLTPTRYESDFEYLDAPPQRPR